MSTRPGTTLADLFRLRLVANPFSAMRTVTVPEVAFSRAAVMLAAVGYWPLADSQTPHRMSAFGGTADIEVKVFTSANDPKRKSKTLETNLGPSGKVCNTKLLVPSYVPSANTLILPSGKFR